jgi:O-antigen/teichoic acid export membrane protein
LNRFSTFLATARKNFGGLVLSGANQAVSSLTNFAALLYLIRVMNKETFGLYGLGLSGVLFITGLMSAAIGMQLAINLPDKEKDLRDIYAVNHAGALVILGMLLISASPIAAEILEIITNSFAEWSLITSVAVASALSSVRDLLTRVAFSARREGVILGSSISAALALVIGYLIIRFAERDPTATLALYAYAAGQAAGAVHLGIALGLPWRQVSYERLLEACRDSWTGGAWSVLTSAVYNFRNQAHSFLVVPMMGAAVLADINAARVLLTPAVMIIPPTTQFFLPRLGLARREGFSILLRTAFPWVTLLTAVSVIYCIALFAVLDSVISVALGEKYKHVGPLVNAWSAFVVGLALRNGLTVVLLVLKRFRIIFWANVSATAFLAVAIVVASGGGNSVWIILAMAASEIWLCFFLATALFIVYRNRASSEASSRREVD